jgi:uncharacterized protein
MSLLKPLVAVVSMVVIVFVLWPFSQSGVEPREPYVLPLTLELADETAEQEVGLSGRKSMRRDHGMLFSFPAGAIPGFWMKGMLFPLDFVWIDTNKVITQIDRNIRPESYPHLILRPKGEVRYVIEVNAGVADELHLSLGQEIEFGSVLE